MNTKVASVSVVILTLAFVHSSAAQEHVGIRVGVSGDPDQFVFGGHIETAPLMDRLVFRPNAEIGLGGPKCPACTIVPNPMALTRNPVRPKVRYCMVPPYLLKTKFESKHCYECQICTGKP